MGIKILQFFAIMLGLSLVFWGGKITYHDIQITTHSIQAKGKVVGFQARVDYPDHYWPCLSFPSGRDSVIIRMDPEDKIYKKGDIVAVIYPRNNPDDATIKSSNWIGATLAVLVGMMFLTPFIYIFLLNGAMKMKSYDTYKGSLEPPAEKRDSRLERFVILPFAGFLIYGAVYMVKKKLSGAEMDGGWIGPFFVCLMAFLFSMVSIMAWIRKYSRNKNI